MNKNILVTGGAGFIGSHLCERLLIEGNKVIIIDNFNEFYDPQIKRNNIIEIKNTMKNNSIDINKIELCEGDFRDIEFLNKLFDNNDIHIVVHLAAMAGVRPSIENPQLYYDVNITGTLNLLEQCRRKNIKKFVFASSSSVYGNNEKVPFSEADIVDNPISPYAATKKSGELMCHTYYHLFDMSIAALRFFTVYGPRQRPDLAIHKFTHLIKNNESIPFFGDGSTSRDYTYIGDIVQGIESSIKYVEENTNVYEVLNLGNSSPVTLKEMINTIAKVLNVEPKIEQLPMQPGDVDRTFADVSKAKRLIGYEPKTSFEEGIEKFVKWYKINKELYKK